MGLDSSSQLTPLTVDFHEPGFVGMLNGETAFRQEKGFWFRLSDEDKQKANSPWVPTKPQALNRYSYVLNKSVVSRSGQDERWYHFRFRRATRRSFMPPQPFDQQLVDARGRKLGRAWWMTLGFTLILGSGAAWLIGNLSGGGILGVVLWLGISISLGWLLIALALWRGIYFEPPAREVAPMPWRSLWAGWLLTLGFILVPLVTIIAIGEVWGKDVRLAAVLVFTLLSLYGPQLLRRLRRGTHLARTGGKK